MTNGEFFTNHFDTEEVKILELESEDGDKTDMVEVTLSDGTSIYFYKKWWDEEKSKKF